MSDEHPDLTSEEIATAKKRALDRVKKERKTKAMADIEAAEVRRLAAEEGLTTGIGVKDEIVNITVDLPTFCTHLSVNGPEGQQYHHGHTYTVPRHVAETLNEMMANAWKHEDEIGGKSKSEWYSRKRMSKIFSTKSGGSTTISGATGAVTRKDA